MRRFFCSARLIGTRDRTGGKRQCGRSKPEIAQVNQSAGWKTEKVDAMLYTIAVVLLILWLLGLVTSYTMGGFIHILLVIAIVLIVVRLIQGKKVI